MISEPQIEDRKDQHYAGIRTKVTMPKLPEVIPQLIAETVGWLKAQGVEPSGAPFIRYHVINMEADMDIEIGWQVANNLSGDDRISTVVIPAGRYGTLIYKDATKGIEGNRALIEWAKKKGLEWDAWDTENGHAFRSRLEFFLDGPDDDPDPANWNTQVAVRLADDYSG